MVTLAVVGAGVRGIAYARHAEASGRGRVVAVADPREGRRARFPSAAQYAGWRELAARPRQADAVIIATQDRDHAEPAVRFAELGYDILLEKPMAVSEDDCRAIVAAAGRSPSAVFAVCHVLRYTRYTRTLKALLDAGRIGEIVSIQHLEPVGWWHQAHSYVRGNWRRADESTFMLLAKSCHDLDWLVHLTGRRVSRVSSFGGLKHFRPENRPDGAADRCLDCAAEPGCPYSAKRIYLPLAGRDAWPVSVLTDDVSEEGVLAALRTGPYGRCVYACDNDVVDHQVVNLEFDGGATASFTMTAFTPALHRQTRIFGTHGSIDGDGDRLTVHDFVTGRSETVETRPTGDATARGGHGGGDEALVEAFLTAVATRDRTPVLSSPGESLHSHLIAWAAERSRLTGETVTLS
ncbi:Gfo/Idh/MocA family oxidoreductase [Actinomadura sp. ATCC 31491]|uniref:Gfo/Idh/MocA family oxidoreductase n=1 Tax=Actinomadura luzonensis TaxID=2805427 RepID=A0ABT0G4M4_9ACTN|nr:Gfo/Idh/MocA family oxidoreductase [Actinomadura luzonensis]MCK2219520.1 Gfo/Idh/MocA family oxidoreductase [Actinomadura luzonensis]